MNSMMCKETAMLNACISWNENSCKRNSLDVSKAKHLKDQLICCPPFRIGGKRTMTAKHRPKSFAGTSINLNQIPRSSTLTQWNENRELMCWREEAVVGSPYYIKNEESVWFSANEPLMLNALWCKGLIHRYSHQVALDFTICILEINNQPFDTEAQSEIKFMGSLTLIKKIKSRVSIPLPLVICPNKIYKIQLKTKSSRYYYHCALWSTEVKLDNDLIVTFHKNPKSEDNERSGLVSCLSFKRFRSIDTTTLPPLIL